MIGIRRLVELPQGSSVQGGSLSLRSHYFSSALQAPRRSPRRSQVRWGGAGELLVLDALGSAPPPQGGGSAEAGSDTDDNIVRRVVITLLGT